MDKILSQEEVDALLKGVVSGEVNTAPTEPQPEPGGTKVYDLLNQERIIRGRMPTLEIINDRFTKSQSASWTGLLRENIEVLAVGTQIIKFGEFLKNLPMPASLNVFNMEPLRGKGLFVMDASLVYLIVDYLFGGKGQTHVKPEGRDFTAVQLRIIKILVEQALADLQKAWAAVLNVRLQHLRSENNPQFAMVVSASEIVLVVTLQVQLGDATRDFFVVYPYAMIEPIKEKLYSGLLSDQVDLDGNWTSRFKDRLQDCPVAVTVRLGTATVSVRDILNFAPGDVLILDQRPGDPLEGSVEGRPKFLGSPGVFKGNHACRVTAFLS
jgi:flagellar motor switch protein FliM